MVVVSYEKAVSVCVPSQNKAILKRKPLQIFQATVKEDGSQEAEL